MRCVDFNIEGPGAKSTAMISLVKTLKAADVPLDGIGFQSRARNALIITCSSKIQTTA